MGIGLLVFPSIIRPFRTLFDHSSVRIRREGSSVCRCFEVRYLSAHRLFLESEFIFSEGERLNIVLGESRGEFVEVKAVVERVVIGERSGMEVSLERFGCGY